MPICQLCQNEKELCKSHLSPAFGIRWIKNTSATGFIRTKENPNLRRQDGPKKKLLCRECEDILNKYETKFSNEIFYPYVEKELDSNGIASGNIKYFEYQDWLLKFIISLQWRVVIDSIDKTDDFPEKFIPTLEVANSSWRDFLLNKSSTTGIGENHLVFLQSFAGGRGSLPKETSNQINFYLLRSIDATIAVGKNIILVYSKIGPIAFLTSLKPNKLKNTPDTRIRMKGKLSTVQHLRNNAMVNFIFLTRPNEVYQNYKISDRQNEIIDKSMKQNKNRTLNSLTISAFEADHLVEHFIKEK